MQKITKIHRIVGYQKIINKKDQVRDHCHITGKFREVAHKICNSKLRIEKNTYYFS